MNHFEFKIVIEEQIAMKKLGFCKSNNFRGNWNLVRQSSDTLDDLSNLGDQIFREVFCQQDKPIMQETLTKSNCTIYKQIDYSNYNQLTCNYNNLQDCFHGILFYIFYYSDKKLNAREIEFYFSGGQERKQLDEYHNDNKYNILNIFNIDDKDSCFEIDSIKDAFFGVTFKRIKINPKSFSYRPANIPYTSEHLFSFVFEGYDENSNKWDSINEQANIKFVNQVADNEENHKKWDFYSFKVRTNKSYSSFRLRQTCPLSNGYWGFLISSFEINGEIKMNV